MQTGPQISKRCMIPFLNLVIVFFGTRRKVSQGKGYASLLWWSLSSYAEFY